MVDKGGDRMCRVDITWLLVCVMIWQLYRIASDTADVLGNIKGFMIIQ